jgi:hypothetical protein
MKISDKWYCEVPEEFGEVLLEIIENSGLSDESGKLVKYVGRGRDWHFNDKYISGFRNESKYISLGYTKIPLEEAFKMIKEYKHDLPETVEVKTSHVLEAAEQCSDFKRIAKTLWPEIF